MSLFGSKSSSSSTQNVDNTNVGASEGALSANHSTVTVIDAGVIEQAFRFASESLGFVDKTATSAQKSFENALATTVGIADEKAGDGSTKLMYLGGTALAAFIFIAYLVKK